MAEGTEEQRRKQSQAEMSETHKARREIEEIKAVLRNSRAIQHEQKEKQKFPSKARLPFAQLCSSLLPISTDEPRDKSSLVA